MDIFADDTMLYNEHMGKTNEHIKMVEILDIDTLSVTEWGYKWMITFNAANNYKNSQSLSAMTNNTPLKSSMFKFLS